MVRIALTGDVMLGRIVNEFINQKGSNYVWGDVLPLLAKHDFSLINLECAITDGIGIWPEPKVFYFKTSPENIECLKTAKIKCVNLANNHTLDFSFKGLEDTLKTLEKNNLDYVGAGRNLEEAQKAAFFTVKGLKIGVIGFTDNEPSFGATYERPGTNYLEINDFGADSLCEVIKKIRGQCDLLICTAHWGPNMRSFPSKEFINFAHKIIDCGADIFHGHSAHLFQGIEIYNKKLIIYDSGDFVDDYAIDSELRNDLSFLYSIWVDEKTGKMKKLELTPVYISHCQVNLAHSGLAEECNRRFQQRNKMFKTSFIKTNGSLELIL